MLIYARWSIWDWLKCGTMSLCWQMPVMPLWINSTILESHQFIRHPLNFRHVVCWIVVVRSSSSQLMVTPFQAFPIAVPRSVVVAPQTVIPSRSRRPLGLGYCLSGDVRGIGRFLGKGICPAIDRSPAEPVHRVIPLGSPRRLARRLLLLALQPHLCE